MKIIVLDGFTLNPGDLNWVNLQSLGALTVYDRTQHSTEATVERIGSAEIVLTNKVPITKEVIDACPNLKYIGVLATGYNVVATSYAKEKNIVVSNVPSYSTDSVAQFTMGLLLEMCHQIGSHSNDVKKGQWQNSPDFCFWNHPLIELKNKTMGIIGFGSIGQATAKLAQAFGLNVIVHTRTVKPEFESDTLRFVDLDTLFKESDIISLHCPLFESTKGIINAVNIDKMKTGVKLINTSRGPLVVEKDLTDALNKEKISGAAVDVVSEEPINPNNPLLKAKNCIITPHIAWAPKEARTRLLQITIDNIIAFQRNEPINVVN